MAKHDGDGAPVKAKGVVHELLAETAKEIAAADWEGRASVSNNFYKSWPSVQVWVRTRWTSYIRDARETLAELLDPSKHYMTNESMRLQIYDALLLNAAVNPAANLVNDVINETSH